MALEAAAAEVAARLQPARRFEIASDRLNWALEATEGVPGLPSGVAVMPAARSHQAVLKMACGSGKTYTVCRAAVPISETRLVLVATCNRLFTRATCADWEVSCGEENVYCYLDGLGQGEAARTAKKCLSTMCEQGRGVIFISIESFLVLNGILDSSKVGLLLLEETCELASKMLSETCPCVRPFRFLREIAQGAERVMYTDADFEADAEVDGRCLRLARYLCPTLPVHIFTLRDRVELTQRSVELFFDDPSALQGHDSDAWWAHLKTWLQKWQRTDSASGNRVAVALPTRQMVRRVCLLAKELGVWWCDYTSETSDHIKNAELKEPAIHWVEIGLVAFTQSLSVGADPQGIEFAAVFGYVFPVGCSVRCLFQGMLRFGRDANFPLKCTTVYLCVKGLPLKDSALEQHEARMEGTSYHARALAMLKVEREQRSIQEHSLGASVAHLGRRAGSWHLGRTCRALQVYGGVRSIYVAPDDEELEIAAWALAEQLEQREDVYTLVKRTLLRHAWIENGAALDAKAALAYNMLPSPASAAAPILLVDVSVEQQLSSLKGAEEQFQWALDQIRGSFPSIDDFHEHCYGLKELSFLSSAEKVLVRTWSLLRRLPRDLIDTVTAAELMELRKTRSAIELHALGICVGSEALRALEAIVRDKAKSQWRALLHSRRLAQADQLCAIDELAGKLLSSAPSFFVDPGTTEVTIGAAKSSVVSALEASRRNEPSIEAERLLSEMREMQRRLGIAGDDVGLAATIKRLCRSAYVDVELVKEEVETGEEVDEEEAEVSQESNARRRRRLVRTPSSTRKKGTREKRIVAVVFKRHVHTYTSKDATGEDQTVVRDFALEWKVESPHVRSLYACAREWSSAHEQAAIPFPSELRRALEEDLGIVEPLPPPPGEGPREDQPVGNARTSGALNNGIFKPPPTPRTKKDGYLERAEMLPWERLCKLIDLVAAQLTLPLDDEMRTMLDRGKKTLARMKRDAASLSLDQNGMKWKPTFYARRMPLGRLTAGASSMQPMPNLLRQWLYRGLLHDLDFVNAHPTIMLGLLRLHRPATWQCDAPRLSQYVERRGDFLDSIVRWYSLPNRDFAKTAILVAINGGELRFWRRKVKSPISPLKPDLNELSELQREALWIRDTIVFGESAFANSVPPLIQRLQGQKRRAGRTMEELKRSAFAYVMGHIESMALEAACAALDRRGFWPTSRIYDGCLAFHNPNGNLAEAIAEAEAEVAKAVGFTGLTIKEKDMFSLADFSIEHTTRNAAQQAALEATVHDEDGDEAD